eukprot:9046064-Pyramimonas_sp.AAC.1
MRSGAGSKKVMQVLAKVTDRLKELHAHREAAAAEAEKMKKHKRGSQSRLTKVKMPHVFGSLALLHVFLDYYVHGNLRR